MTEYRASAEGFEETAEYDSVDDAETWARGLLDDDREQVLLERRESDDPSADPWAYVKTVYRMRKA